MVVVYLYIDEEVQAGWLSCRCGRVRVVVAKVSLGTLPTFCTLLAMRSQCRNKVSH